MAKFNVYTQGTQKEYTITMVRNLCDSFKTLTYDQAMDLCELLAELLPHADDEDRISELEDEVEELETRVEMVEEDRDYYERKASKLEEEVAQLKEELGK